MNDDMLDGMASEAVNKGGRPTIYNEEVSQDICRLLMVGKSLRKICDLEGMPSITTVMRWLSEDKGTFREQYAHARDIQAEYLLDEMIDIADDSINDYEIVDGQERVNHEHLNRSKLRIDARKWVIEKQAPKKYGSKQQIDHTTGGKEIKAGLGHFYGRGDDDYEGDT